MGAILYSVLMAVLLILGRKTGKGFILKHAAYTRMVYPVIFKLLSGVFRSDWPGVGGKLMFLYGRKTTKELFCLHLSVKVASMIIFASFPVFYLSFSKATGIEVALACSLPFAGLILPDMDLRARIKRRKEEIMIDFPAFCTELAIMSGSGLEIQEAWRQASRRNTDSEFYREARFAVSRTETGALFRDSLQEFSARMAIPEIHTFISILSQAIKTGGGSLVEMLRNCACQSWELRSENARKKGEEASAKLVFPLALGLAGIMIILTAPALIIMKGL